MTDGIITTARLRLEYLSAEQAEAILHGPTADDWGEGFPASGELKAAKWVLTDDDRGLQHSPFLTYLIRELDTGLLIGGAGFHGRPKDRRVEVGYGLSPAYWGHGYATEACRAMAETALDSGLVDVVFATTDRANAPSMAVLRRAGFVATSPLQTYWVFSAG